HRAEPRRPSVAAAAEPTSGSGAGRAAALDDDRPAHNDGLDPFRLARRLVDRRATPNGRRIEDHEVGDRAVADRPAVREPETGSGHAGHPADRVLEPEEGLVADELAEDSRV